MYSFISYDVQLILAEAQGSSLLMCMWNFPFPIPSGFYKSLYFLLTKVWTLTLTVIIPFKIKIIENLHTVLLRDI